MHQSTVTADKVDADRLGSGIQRFGKPHGVASGAAPSSMAMGVTLMRLLTMGMP